ncbi:MAG: hypothetical protein NTW21_35430, partial [Verrucomicrobia bacterium]|nr:hypothetical protein [Verrucomicrobiota bacterium]
TDFNSSAASSYRLSMAMGQPLAPGTYYIGFYNSTASVVTSCSLSSRAIGDGMSYSPAPVAFDGGEAAITNLAPRDVAYFYVDVPANQPSWKLRLENTSGETTLYVRKDRVCTLGNYYASHASSAASIYDYPATTTARLGRTGDESYILTPEGGENTLRAGRYYIMVLSLGLNPTSEQVGSGTSGAVLRSMGNAPVTNLGTLPLAGPLELADGYAGGENKLYNFVVPAGVLALEVRLLNRVGAPTMALCAGTKFLYLPAYGMFASDWSPPSTSLITLANPGTGTYSMCIAEPGTSDPSAGTYTLQINTVGATTIPFDGGNATISNLAPSNWTYFVTDVPATVGGKPVLGWELKVSNWAGARPTMVVRRGSLPNGAGTSNGGHDWSRENGDVQTSTTWNAGNQWATSSLDWTSAGWERTDFNSRA